jgi:uncharacterized repeat protein (TIGR01451 family)
MLLTRLLGLNRYNGSGQHSKRQHVRNRLSSRLHPEMESLEERLLLSATIRAPQEGEIEYFPTEVGVDNPLVLPGNSITGFQLNKNVNTWIPFTFKFPTLQNLVVEKATLQVIVAEVDAAGDGFPDDLPDTDAVLSRGSTPGAYDNLFGNFTRLYSQNDDPLSQKLIDIDLTRFPNAINILNTESRFDVVVEDDASVYDARLFVQYGPKEPIIAKATDAQKICRPREHFAPAPLQNATASFPLIPPQNGGTLECGVSFNLELTARNGDRGPVTVLVQDELSNGLQFVQLTSSSPTVNTVASNGGKSLSFNFDAQLPNGSNTVTIPVLIAYEARLTDESREDAFEFNEASLTLIHTPTAQTLQQGPIGSVRFVPLVPEAQCEQAIGSTAGVPGDRKSVTVLMRNPGNVDLQTVQVAAVLPTGASFVPGSANPPESRVVGNTIVWDNVGPASAFGGGVAVSYDIIIGPNLTEGTQLVFQASGRSTAPHPQAADASLPGPLFQLINTPCDTQTIVIAPIHVGIDMTLSANPAAGVYPRVVTYTATITNNGDFPLDPVNLFRDAGTRPLGGTPQFPVEIGRLEPGQSKQFTYRGLIDILQTGTLTDTGLVTGFPVNNGVSVAPPVRAVAAAPVSVLHPIVTRITPATIVQGATDQELVIEGINFSPGFAVSFSPGSGIDVIRPTAPYFGFYGADELHVRINVAANAPVGDVQLFVNNPNGYAGGESPFNVFTITAGQDTTPPVLSNMPPNQTIVATSSAGAVVTYALPSASDNSDPAPDVVCAPPSGSTFPIGERIVSCTATDAAGNFSVESFHVTVQGPTGPPVIAMPFVLSGRILGVGLIFNVFLDSAAAGNPSNYRIATNAGRDKRFGTADDKLVSIEFALYDGPSNSVLLLPTKPLKQNALFRVTVQGAGTGLGSDYGILMGRGTKLSITDRDGDQATLVLANGGILDLQQLPEDVGPRLSVLDAVPGFSTLSAKVKESSRGDGRVVIQSLTGTSGVGLQRLSQCSASRRSKCLNLGITSAAMVDSLLDSDEQVGSLAYTVRR